MQNTERLIYYAPPAIKKELQANNIDVAFGPTMGQALGDRTLFNALFSSVNVQKVSASSVSQFQIPHAVNQ